MKPATWRAILLASCAGGALLVFAGFFDQIGIGGAPPWYGIMGGYISGSSEPWSVSFRGIDPAGPADRAGIRDGDLIDVRGQSALTRLSLMGQPLAGRPLRLEVRSAGRTSRRVFVPGPFSVSRYWPYFVWEFASLWLLLFAALIAWRRPYADNNLLLAGVIVCTAIAIASQLLNFAWPWTWAYVASILAGQAEPLAVGLWATLASAFARPLSPVRRVALALCYAAVAIWIVLGNGTPDNTLGLAPLLGIVTSWFDPTRFIGPAWTITEVSAVIMATACSIFALVASRGIERKRAAWLLVPCTVLFCEAVVALLGFHFLPYWLTLDSGASYSVVAIVTPLILTYAALNRRLIDVGFILNRTVVFAIVSSIVIGAFIVVEWAAGAWLVNASHTTSVIVGMAVALALGLSMRYIHRYVDRFVDNVLFRKRHEDETALRRFAHEASYINDRAMLLERTLKIVCDHTTAQTSEIILSNGSDEYSPASDPEAEHISENDPAIVALRAWSKPVDLHDVAGTRLRGELAFPMASRGRLVGALICGPKRDGEAYAPDESEALAALAHAVGSALDVLEARNGGSETVLAQLAQSIRELSDMTRRLPDELAHRMVMKATDE